jgi:hypothetical protein
MMDGSMGGWKHTEPCGGAVGVEVVDLWAASAPALLENKPFKHVVTYIHVDGVVESSIEFDTGVRKYRKEYEVG